MFYTTQVIADIFSAAGDRVTLINRDANYAAWVERTAMGLSEDMWKEMIKRINKLIILLKRKCLHRVFKNGFFLNN